PRSARACGAWGPRPPPSPRTGWRVLRCRPGRGCLNLLARPRSLPVGWDLPAPYGLRVRSDFLIIADGAQVADGKLYLLGGAWNRLALPQFPGSAPIAVALGLMVGW